MNSVLYRSCLAGKSPAEALSQPERSRLVAELHGYGWTDREIAEHCRMTSYTTARIRSAMNLRQNPETSRLRGVA